MITIAVHGGAGLLGPIAFSDAEQIAYEDSLRESLRSGFAILQRGASARDAVVAAVQVLEDSPLFNAGRGSVLARDEKIQMDAAIMCGRTQACGGVTLIERIKNPILAAKAVMEKTSHRLLGGPDAEAFAREQGLELCDRSYFLTERRQQQLRAWWAQQTAQNESNTVGAVARDVASNVAAATSTGGVCGKLPGRVSDSSIVGAGTYANNATLAISGTGTGDYFIQNALCFDAHALMAYRELGLAAACAEVLQKLQGGGGHGGVIAVTAQGEVCLDFNCDLMFRGHKTADRERVAIMRQ